MIIKETDQNMDTPVISIVCDVYNHAAFLRQCLDGLMMQQTSFSFEVLIHDDASTDESQEIIKEYASKHPSIIKPIYQTENKYSKGISIWRNYQFPRAQGKYIAICEGDDYWSDPLKLEKQISFLEMHANYTLSYTKSKVFNHSLQKFENYILGKEKTSYFDLLKSNEIPALSACIKTSIAKEYIDKILNNKYWTIGDYPLWLYAASKGKIHFLNEECCVYRVLQSSLSHHNSYQEALNFNKQLLDIKNTILRHHPLSHKKRWVVFNETYFMILESIMKYNQSKGAIKYFLKAIPYDKRTKEIWWYFIRKCIF